MTTTYDSAAMIHLAAALLTADSPDSDCIMITDSIRELRHELTLEQGDKIIRAADNAGSHTEHIADAIRFG